MSNGRPWTSDDDARLRRLNAAGHGDDEIGADMGRHPKFIGAKRRELGLRRGLSAGLVAMMGRINLRRMARA